MIEVRTCARLHLGLLDNSGKHGRLYGSIGLAVDHPNLVLRAEKSESLVIEGMETDRVSIYAQRFIGCYGLPAGAYLNLLASIPAHVGLGSGTQIALAVGAALTRLAGLHLSMEEIALAGGGGFVRVLESPPFSTVASCWMADTVFYRVRKVRRKLG